MKRFFLHWFPFRWRDLFGAAATCLACLHTRERERWEMCCWMWRKREGNEIEKRYKNKFEREKNFPFFFFSQKLFSVFFAYTSTFRGEFIVRSVLPWYESSSAFRLLVGTMRCGKRGEPLTRSRSVGCEFWWIIELRLRFGRMKLTLGSDPHSSASSISTSGAFSISTWALIIKAIDDFRRFRLFISSGSTISIEELIALPLCANDDLRSETGSSGFELRTWHDELVFGKSPVSILICDFNALAMWDGANEAVEVFRLGARDPNNPLMRFKIPLLSWFCCWLSLKFNKSIAGTRAPFSSTICGWELKQMERRIGIVICSAFGHEALGITGGRTESNKSGRVPEMLGRFDFDFSPKLLSMIISG